MFVADLVHHVDLATRPSIAGRSRMAGLALGNVLLQNVLEKSFEALDQPPVIKPPTLFMSACTSGANLVGE